MKRFKKKRKRNPAKYHYHDFKLDRSPYPSDKYIFWSCRFSNCNVEVRWVRDNYNWATSSTRTSKYGYWSKDEGRYREWSN